MDLQEALERTGKAYDKERLHPAPTDVVAQNIGYRGANNGSALAALASLRYYGLMERPREGVLAVSKDFENYRFAPNEGVKRALVQKFFQTPPLFRELLEQYDSGFPSDATLKYELIQRGFLPQPAAALVAVLKRSAEFADTQQAPPSAPAVADAPEAMNDAAAPGIQNHQSPPPAVQSASPVAPVPPVGPPSIEVEATHDRIPVRLSGNRRAWLVIPEPFFEADKKRLKAQIDLLLTEDDEADDDL
ncbi:hypothetical protein LJR130_004530 [Variovorax sp. LjRoot130]|uniref:hypothetical protein n=1 Tax=Variovorax sp. LjRoot130 TaxID=3342261 RepID=UPI003ECE7BD1